MWMPRAGGLGACSLCIGDCSAGSSVYQTSLKCVSLKGVPMKRYQSIRIVQPKQFNRATAQTPGSERRAGVSTDMGIETSLWGGIFVVEPGARTSIHHHGEQETIAYVLEGKCVVRWGEHGETSAAADAGDFIHVPAWLPHMEINASAKHRLVWVVVRSTTTPIVVNLGDDYWD
jgi:uncharacterized RmlC-like cupin family protein